jgi:anti-sigma regulatory factor (Ser/Thr protein kinase)
MAYATCPNCAVTLESAGMMVAPSACPDCCARLEPGVGLPVPARPPRVKATPSFDAVLGTGAETPRAARHAFESFASPFGRDLAATGALLISELVTNAVLHGPPRGASRVELHFETVGETLQVEVSDEGDGFAPVVRHDAQDVGSGWGLHIVEALADSWGVDHGRPTRVWFELPLA